MTVAGESREADAARDAVRGVARALAATEAGLPAALADVARVLADALDGAVLVSLLDEGGARLDPAALAHPSGRRPPLPAALAAVPPLSAAHPLAARLFRASGPVRWPDRGAPRADPPPAEHRARVDGDALEPAEAIRALFGAPAPAASALVATSVCVGDEAVGMVAVALAGPEGGAGAAAEALAAVADLLGPAVERERLRDRVRVLERGLAEREAALREAAEARDASEARYRLFAAASSEGITVHERGRHVDTNEAFARMLGYAPDEIRGTTAWDLAAPESRPIIRERIARRSDEPYEIVGIRKDGTRIDLEVRGRTLEHEGRTLRVAAIRDIGDRKRAEAALRESRDQLDIVLRGVADGIVAQDPNGRIDYANDAAAGLFGFASGADLIAAPPGWLTARFDVVGEDGRPLAPEQYPNRRALQGEHVVTMPLRFVPRTTGEERWALVTSTPVRADDGAIPYVITIFRDVTEQRRTEARLRFLADTGALLPASLSVRETLDGLARAAAATLADWSTAYVVGPGERIERVAVAVADPAKQALADALLAHPSGGPGLASELLRALRSGQPRLIPRTADAEVARAAWDAEHLRLLRALGMTSEIWVPLVARGRTVGALALFASTEARRFASEDLALAVEIGRRAALAVDNARLYEEARAAIEARDVFLSIASHELRTPVTVIKGTAQMLERARARGILDEGRLARFLGMFADASDRLTELTDDLLDVARLRTGLMELALVPLDLGRFAREVAERYVGRLAERHALALATEDGVVVRADRLRLEQVLANLLTNAAKYSPDGGEVAVRVARADGGALLEVRDRGIGLPPGAAEAIFEPFGRAPNAVERQIQGMGLGLHIARGIVERHGGRIWAESDGPNLGTTVRVWLPLAAEDGPASDGDGVREGGAPRDG